MITNGKRTYERSGRSRFSRYKLRISIGLQLPKEVTLQYVVDKYSELSGVSEITGFKVVSSSFTETNNPGLAVSEHLHWLV